MERSYDDLRRIMRSLIADQNNTFTNIGRFSINGVANKYGFHNNENIVNTKLMESFLGSEKYEIARQMYKAKEDYDDFIKSEPNSVKYIKKLVGGYEFINNAQRYVLWLVGVSPNEIKKMPILEFSKQIREVKFS